MLGLGQGEFLGGGVRLRGGEGGRGWGVFGKVGAKRHELGAKGAKLVLQLCYLPAVAHI